MVFFVDKLNIQFMHWMSQCFFGGYYMTSTDKKHFIYAYEELWKIINPNDNIAIDINPNGWYEIKILINSTSIRKTVRASYLMKQLAVMAGRINHDINEKELQTLRHKRGFHA